MTNSLNNLQSLTKKIWSLGFGAWDLLGQVLIGLLAEIAVKDFKNNSRNLMLEIWSLNK
jgi:hypothetical protein